MGTDFWVSDGNVEFKPNITGNSYVRFYDDETNSWNEEKLGGNGVANQGGDQVWHGAGTLDIYDLLDYYEHGKGGDYRLTKNTFDTFINAMFIAGKLNYDEGVPVPNVKGLYQVVVDTRGTDYYYAVGLTVVYYNSTGFVGYADWWNFDPKPWGTRTFWGEVVTRYGSTLLGRPFMVIYGITPPENTIPRH